MKATFSSTCAACDNRIEPGDEIVRDNDSATFIHARCPDDPDEEANRIALASGRCPTCGLNHPGEC